MNKKKILTLCLVACLAITAIAGASLAYFTDTKSATNTFTVGNVSAELYESKYHRGAPTGYLSITGQPNPTTDDDIIADSQTYQSDYLKNATLMPFAFTSNQALVEKCTVAKNAYVKNTGNNDCYVRVNYLIPSDIANYLDIFYTNSQFCSVDANGKFTYLDGKEHSLDNTDNFEPMITTVSSLKSNAAAQIGNTTTIDGKEYYVASFIYAEALTPGEMTLYSPISKIILLPTVTDETIQNLNLTNRQFEIEVKAEVIQADGFAGAIAAFKAFDA